MSEAIERWIRFYQSDRHPGQDFNAFSERVGSGEFEARIKDLAMPVEFNLHNMNYFVDRQRSAPFQVVLGEGERAV